MANSYPYCGRTNCFGNMKVDGGITKCKCLIDATDADHCKFFKTVEQYKKEKEKYEKEKLAGKKPMTVIKTASAKAYI